jgi:hypothetical protein
MDKLKILVQRDTDAQPSVFDSVVAIDAGVDQLLRQAGVTAKNVRNFVHGAIFTRGPGDLKRTALFIGGSDVALGASVLEEVKRAFLGPLRVSVMLDPAGANTTAAAAALAAARHLTLKGTQALVLAATGPVGQRVVRLLAREQAVVRVGSRSVARAQEVVDEVAGRVKGARLTAVATSSAEQVAKALDGVELLIAAGAAGIELVGESLRLQAKALRVAIDLNAVPPYGLSGVEVTDKAQERSGVICHGALGVGGTKMKIHKAAIGRLFDANDQIFDAEQLYELGKSF